MRFATAVLFAVALFLQACSGLRPVETQTETDPAAQAPAYPAYEAFDPAGYDAEPQAAVEVVHDVPARIMQGRVEVPGGETAPTPAPQEPRAVQVEGFRVQVFTSSSREAAERVRSEAVAWWSRSQPGRSVDALVAYRQPYYRVQLGGYADRADADAALAVVRRQYPEAFIVPDLVTVMR